MAFPSQDQMLADTLGFLRDPLVSTPLMLCLSTVAAIVLFLRPSQQAKSSTIEDVVREFGGSFLMIFFCFTPGPFLGHLTGYEEWLGHGLGLIASDYMSGGPHGNPAVSFAMILFREISVDEFLIKVSAQMMAGIVAFPLLQFVSSRYGVTIGGPEFEVSQFKEALLDEAIGTFLLLTAVAVFCMTWFGQYYFTRMTLIAATIRGLCVWFASAGPSLNPMLATTWFFFKHGEWPRFTEHYLVYWAAPFGSAALAVGLFTTIWKFSGNPSSEEVTLKQVWEEYYRTITSKDSTETQIVSFFAPGAKLVTCKDGVCTSLEPGTDKFAKHFYSLATASKKGASSPQTVVDQAARTVFVKWAISRDLSGTDSIMFDEHKKIVRQHTTLFK